MIERALQALVPFLLVSLPLWGTPPIASPPAPPIAPPPAALFELRSAFWINLHHFLLGAAQKTEDPAPALGGPLTEGEERGWKAALAVYRSEYAKRDSLFDPGMIAINNALGDAAHAAAAGGSPSLPAAGLPAALVTILEAAAPAYRAHWWPAHDAANRAWIAAVEPRLARFGPPIAARLGRAYQTEWPKTSIPVDVTVDAGRFGAYTTGDPTHVTLSSVDPRGKGDAGLESLFHEASHGWDQKLIDGVTKAAAERGRPVPDGLWHAILFYTVGEATAKVLGAGGSPGYVPYAIHEGLYEHRGWQGYRRAIEIGWQPYLDGKTDFATALRAVLDALPVAKKEACPPRVGALRPSRFSSPITRLFECPTGSHPPAIGPKLFAAVVATPPVGGVSPTAPARPASPRRPARCCAAGAARYSRRTS
jgi:hypothetical protein